MLGEENQFLTGRRHWSVAWLASHRKGNPSSANWFAMAAGVKISPSRLASSRHFLSSPLRRTASARDSSRLSVSISAFSSAMVRAAVAWSRISSSAASTSLSGASSRSSTSSSSSTGRDGSNRRDRGPALEQLQLA